MATTREFGTLAHILAEAIGQPGQRRFRLLAMSEDGSTAFFWPSMNSFRSRSSRFLIGLPSTLSTSR